ncbi:putative baseplate assembly protein V (gpv) [Novosphingobium sp. Rr 2-17]|uniref:phage baseplate assembly protein V n=1 Tax=Novosphingobium sp. Rr 2-17 TaxID=555793 RepID=UPI00026985A4|nr:phage baseplate assembly protein V [Novosphingobium sp. Rr 2-17]EIZ77776.1 putative baseplate assembly protein V (gpv) [Novosphingobium sp. Rr 2-17]
MARSSDPEQLTGEVIQLGTVASVDHGAATCTVEIGDLVTGDLPWLAARAGNVRIWSSPSIGEQCAVLCPEGDLANGLVLLGVWSDANPAPSDDPNVVLIEFPDGAVLSYNHATHALSAVLPAGGTGTIDAPGGLTINGPVTINDDVFLKGTLTASEDVIAASISLKGHKHSNVQAGAAQSGSPV